MFSQCTRLPAALTRTRLPVVGAPLFIISNPNLVLAQVKAGIIGSFPSLNARTPDILNSWLTTIKAETASHDAAHPDAPAAPFSVNLIVHKSNTRLEIDTKLCVEHKVPVIITSLGAREDVNAAIHSYGGIVLHDVINDKFARKAVSKGADGLILVANGAGGHAGSLSPFSIVNEIRQWYDGPVLLSGCISHGGAILAAQAMGADFAYIGSPFIATDEAAASTDYKQGIIDGTAEDIVTSSYFTGVSGNYLRKSIENNGFDPENLPKGDVTTMNFDAMAGAPEAKAWKDIWGCGQGIDTVKKVQPAGDLVRQYQFEYESARKRLTARP